MDKIKGSMEALSAMQLTNDMKGLDAQSKLILRNREVLAIILQEVVEEYRDYSRKEIMDFIEADTITEQKEISPGRTNTSLQGESTEYTHLNEKTSNFDLAFRAKNPRLSRKGVLVSLHIDVEPQKTYHPGYPIEKRGMYYLARRLSSQLSLATERTDYGQLEKCYSIFICRDDIPKEAHYSISVYEVINTKHTSLHRVPREHYDLMTLVIIKLGNKVYNGSKGEDGYDLLRFLNAIMYPHTEGFMDTMAEYIDFSDNEELWEEVTHMSGLGESIFEEGKAEGIRAGREAGRSEGIQAGRSEGIQAGRLEGIQAGRLEGRTEGIQALILDNLEEGISKERILLKLQKHFNLEEEQAGHYYEKFASDKE